MINPIFHTKAEETSASYGKFVIEPLPLSFGNSMGNALRRTLLSSLPGAAITQIRFKNAEHMFSVIDGVKESALEIILNMKQLRFETAGEGPFHITLSATKEGKVYAKSVDGNAKVVNEDLYIAEITSAKGKLDIEAVVERGVGSIMEEEVEKEASDFIAVDAFFSPVKKVNFKIEAARVGRKTNFDRLMLEVWTDGTIEPEQAVKDASEILAAHFSYLFSGHDAAAEKEQESAKPEKVIDQHLNDIIIDELNLPSRVINALLREGVETVADLVRIGKDKLIGVKGLGKKSFTLIEEELRKMDIVIDMDEGDDDEDEEDKE